MTDPIYLKLKEDAGIVLRDLWRAVWPAKKSRGMTGRRAAAVAPQRLPKPGAH